MRPDPDRFIATVVILTLNGERHLGETLERIAGQRLGGSREVEVLVIDSGSTDRTLEILSRSANQPRIEHIQRRDFNHGETRNLAARLARGEFVVYLTQDATPAHDRWLANLLEPLLLSERIGCVYGAQRPRSDACVLVKREVSERFPVAAQGMIVDRSVSLVDGVREFAPDPFLSNANSAVRRDLVVDTVPFRRLPYSEDQALARDMQDRGYLKAYAPQAAVWHSNELSLTDLWRRKRDEYLGLARALDAPILDSELSLLLGWIKPTLRDWRFALRDPDYSTSMKLSQCARAPALNLVAKVARYTSARTRAREMDRATGATDR